MLLGNAKRKSLFRFTDVVSRILAEQHDPSMIDKWEEDTNFALAIMVMERDFPISLQVLFNY